MLGIRRRQRRVPPFITMISNNPVVYSHQYLSINIIETMMRVVTALSMSGVLASGGGGGGSSFLTSHAAAFLIPTTSTPSSSISTSTSSSFITSSSSSSSSSPHLPTQIVTRHAREPTRIYYRDDDENSSSFDAMMNNIERRESPRPTSTTNTNEDYNTSNTKSPSSDFQSRMKRIVIQQQKDSASISSRRLRRPNVKSVVSLEEFASVIDDGRREGKLIVVRFHATWCKVS